LKFEWDEEKSLLNKKKHGIDFNEATKLFTKDVIVYPAKNVLGEKRFMISNFLNDKCYSAIFTLRGDIIRIISVRRCRENEKLRIKK